MCLYSLDMRVGGVPALLVSISRSRILLSASVGCAGVVLCERPAGRVCVRSWIGIVLLLAFLPGSHCLFLFYR